MPQHTTKETQYAITEMFGVIDRVAQAHFNNAFDSKDDDLIDKARDSEMLNREIQNKIRANPYCELTDVERSRLKSLIDIFFNMTMAYGNLVEESIFRSSPVYKKAQIMKAYSYEI